MMKHAPLRPVRRILFAALLLSSAAACGQSDPTPDPATPPAQTQPDNDPSEPMQTKITLTLGGRTFAATLRDNAAARAFVQLLPLTLDMSELNGNEKYANLPTALPTQAATPGTLRTGDLMLYGSDCVVLFYQTFSSSYSYTTLGALDSTEGLETAVGTGRVQVTFAVVQ